MTQLFPAKKPKITLLLIDLLTKQGQIPKWLKGSLLRVGPGKFEIGDQSYNHLFDGLCLIHRFNIEGSNVTYQNRFLRSDSYVLAQQQNRIVVTEFGTNSYPDPCKNIFSRFFSYFWGTTVSTDNCNVNLMQVRDEVYAMTESPVMRRVDPETLGTHKEKVDCSKYVALNQMTAHPHTDRDGTIYNMAARYGKDGLFGLVKIPLPDEGMCQLSNHLANSVHSQTYIKTPSWHNNSSISQMLCDTATCYFSPGGRNDPTQKAYMVGSVPQESKMKPNYFHSFGLTENYVVFVEQPMYINVWKLMLSKFTSGKGVSAAMEFDKNTPTRFHVLEKESGKVIPTVYLSDSFFTFHHINTYEEDGQLVVDICCDDKGDGITALYLENLRGADGTLADSIAEAKRYVLPLQTVEASSSDQDNLVATVGTEATAVLREDGSVFCTPEKLCPGNVDLPRINYDHYNGRKYQFFFGVSGQLDMLLKCDIETKSSKSWTETGCYPSEPVFVPAPGATAEDEGVVLSLVVKSSSGEDRSVFLLVLDGETFGEVARAEVPSPAQACMTFHGIFLPNV
ncbi:carotenoid-cleaving dioxygenase, mitochondrial-like [Branchiostoma lanceolatum]|uniref:carotenoid-cleaving dioxygenase, mitochondrial-like n=1 Tax=Branchiostoma lanceolatum TaxID=7740 RepID=UPI003456819F